MTGRVSDIILSYRFMDSMGPSFEYNRVENPESREQTDDTVESNVSNHAKVRPWFKELFVVSLELDAIYRQSVRRWDDETIRR